MSERHLLSRRTILLAPFISLVSCANQEGDGTKETEILVGRPPTKIELSSNLSKESGIKRIHISSDLPNGSITLLELNQTSAANLKPHPQYSRFLPYKDDMTVQEANIFASKQKQAFPNGLEFIQDPNSISAFQGISSDRIGVFIVLQAPLNTDLMLFLSPEITVPDINKTSFVGSPAILIKKRFRFVSNSF